MKNETLIKASREILLAILLQLKESQQEFFKRIYYNHVLLTIEDAVDRLPVEKIDWAISQAEATLRKNNNHAKS